MITLSFICVSIYFIYVSYILFGLFRHTIKNEKKEDNKRVSVVIAARNEEKYLPGLLNDLVNQDYPKNKLEIILIIQPFSKLEKLLYTYAQKLT